MNNKEASLLVKFARESIISKFEGKKFNPAKVPENLKKKQGVFVTLEKYPSKMLRGCIGYIEGIKPLYEAVIDVAKAAAFGDPRFKELRADELDKLTVEISILSVPSQLSGTPRDYVEQIQIGRDGLIVEYGWNKGLLLPQVATEYGVSPIEFLEMTCEKAGLPRGSWADPKVKVYKFSAELWREATPGGKVIPESAKTE